MSGQVRTTRPREGVLRIELNRPERLNAMTAGMVEELHGWGELGDRLHTLSREGRWAEMGPLVDDEVLTAFAVVGAPGDAGREVARRYGDVFDRLSLYTPYDVDPGLVTELAAAVRQGAGVAG